MPSYDHGVTGLTGTIGVTIYAANASLYQARTASGITEPVAGTGVYHYAHPAAGTLLLFIFDGGVGTVGGSCFDDGLDDSVLYKARVNKRVVTASADIVYDDDDLTPLITQALTDSTSTATRGKAT